LFRYDKFSTNPEPVIMSGGGKSLPDEIVNIDIVVATERDSSSDALLRDLQRTRNHVKYIWPVPEMLPADTDVIFCDLLPNLPLRLPWLPGEPKAALVVLVAPGVAIDLDLLRKTAPEAVLHRPFTTSAVLSSLVLARSRFTYERRLRGRLEKMDATLRTMRSVERAKIILMNARKLNEDEAYGVLRRQAMQRRVSVGAIAAAIVDADDLMG
jgi:AmiR/NasT family two-component response regulator